MDWSKLLSYEGFVDIIVPIIAALLGGGITMWGVICTIKHEHKNVQEQTIQAAKPWIFSLDAFEHYDYKNTGSITLEGNSPIREDIKLSFIIRNTDNGIGIIDKFITANNEYMPVIGRILDKNSVNHVTVVLNENESLEDMYFIFRDVYGNRYKYRAYQTGKTGKGNHIEEIGLISKEKKQKKMKFFRSEKMKKNGVFRLTVLFFVGIALVFALDYFNIFSLIGFNVDQMNFDILSIVIGNGIVVYLFLVAYKLLDKRNIEKENNKRKIALLMLKGTYVHCKELLESLSDDEARKSVAQKCDFDKVIFKDEMFAHMRNLPFRENGESIMAFAQEGVISSKEIDQYFDAKQNYIKNITEMIICFEPHAQGQWIGAVDENMKTLDNLISEINKELSKSDTTTKKQKQNKKR